MPTLPLVMMAGLLAAADSGTTVELDGLKSTTPAAWTAKELTAQQKAMRKHQFVIPKAEGDKEDGELVIFYFGPGQGGGVEDNIKRWKSQFKDLQAEAAKQESMKVGDVKVTRVDINGTYMFKARPFDPNDKGVEKPDFKMTGVVFESKNGPYFFRLVGPKKTIEAQNEAFAKWLTGFK